MGPSRPTRSWEHLVLGAGYRFCLFDGLSRFYVAEEKADELGPLLQTPANILDNYVTYRQAVLSAELDAVRADMIRHDEMNQGAILEWRTAAIRTWLHAADGSVMPEREEELLHQIHLHVNHIQFVDEQLETERAVNDAMRRTLSWRVTRPLRGLRALRSVAKGERFLSELNGTSAADVTANDADLEQALAGRLRAAADHLLDKTPPGPPRPRPDESGALLDGLVRSVQADLAPDRLWLLLTALCAAYPTRDEVAQARRLIELSGPLTAAANLLHVAFPIAYEGGHLRASLEVVEGRVVVDVDHSAKYDLHTGIQRVTRIFLPLSDRDHDVVPVAWNRASGALHRLSLTESARVLQWAPARTFQEQVDAARGETADERDHLIVPWKSVVVMVEVPTGRASDRLAAMGDVSGNRLVAVAHDAIPVVSADMVPPEESAQVHAVPHRREIRLAGGGRVTVGRRGDVRLRHRAPDPGLDRTNWCPRSALGSPEVPPATGERDRRRGPERARRRLPRTTGRTTWPYSTPPRCSGGEGVRFSLTFIGGSGWREGFPERVAASSRTRAARWMCAGACPTTTSAPPTVPPRSACSRPCTRASACRWPSRSPSAPRWSPPTSAPPPRPGRHGGAVLIDPWDDGALIEAMRTLLTDPVALDHLREEARHRAVRDWHEYAADLWAWLVCHRSSRW